MTDPQTRRPPSGPPVSTPGRGAAAPELASRVLPGSAPTPWCPRPAPAFRPGALGPLPVVPRQEQDPAT